jgi:hypothetical protein
MISDYFNYPPNSFGVEWDTNALIFIEDSDNVVVEKGIINYGPNWSITKESYWPNRIVTPKDCVASLEAQLGVFYSIHPLKFNGDSYHKTCSEFQKAWMEIIDNTSITVYNKNIVYPVLSVVTTKEEPLYPGTTDCAGTQPGYYKNIDKLEQNKSGETIITQRGKYQSYVRNLSNVRGVPQLTMGFQLQYCMSIWDYTTNIFNHWNNYGGSEILRHSNAVERIVKSYNSTNRQINLIIRSGVSISTNVSNLILLCNNHLISLNRQREEGKYLKASMFYKVRTNLRGVYDSFSIDDKKVFDFWSKWIKNESFRDYPDTIWSAKKWVKHFNNPLVGYMLDNIPSKITTVLSKIGIYSIENSTIDIMKEYGITVTKVNYISSYSMPTDNTDYQWTDNLEYIPAPLIYLTEDYELVYYDNNEILAFDIGEWYYKNQIIIEARGLDTIYQLIMGKEKNWFRQPTTHISVVDLCRVRKSQEERRQFYFSDIIEYYLNKILYFIK